MAYAVVRVLVTALALPLGLLPVAILGGSVKGDRAAGAGEDEDDGWSEGRVGGGEQPSSSSSSTSSSSSFSTSTSSSFSSSLPSSS